MKWQGVLNPNAGGGRALKHIAKINTLAPNLLELTTVSDIGGIRPWLNHAISTGQRSFAVAGGDGTYHHFINQACSLTTERITLLPIPLGSGNDWLRSMQTSNSIRALPFRLTHPKYLESKLIKVTSDHGCYWGLNSVGCGFDTQVLEYIDRNPAKRLRYWRGLLRMLSSRNTINSSINNSTSERFILILVGLGKYAGQGFKLLPEACLNGPLAMTKIHPLSNFELYRELPFLKSGRFVSNQNVDHQQVQNELTLQFDQPQRFQIDGELYPQTRHLKIELVSDRLRVLT
jgi:diacylglycerol kinase family enzyme